MAKQGIYHTPSVGKPAEGFFYLCEKYCSDKRFFVKKNNEQNCRDIFDEKRPSRFKREDAYIPSDNEKIDFKS